jgi:hypothetical protein
LARNSWGSNVCLVGLLAIVIGPWVNVFGHHTPPPTQITRCPAKPKGNEKPVQIEGASLGDNETLSDAKRAIAANRTVLWPRDDQFLPSEAGEFVGRVSNFDQIIVQGAASLTDDCVG